MDIGVHPVERIGDAFSCGGGECIGIGIYAWACPSTRPHAGILLDQIQCPMNVCFLCVKAASKREKLGRVINAMSDNRSLWDKGMKLLPKIGMVLGKKRIQGNAQGHCLLIKEPANPRNTPFYRVLTKRLVDNTRMARTHAR